MRELERVQDRLLERDALHAQRSRPREVEQLRGERVEPHRLLADELAGAPRLVPRREALLHHRGRAADHAERIAHLVGDAGGEASDRRELLVLERRALRRLERAQLPLDRGGVCARPLARHRETPHREAERAERELEEREHGEGHVAAGERHVGAEEDEGRGVERAERDTGGEAPEVVAPSRVWLRVMRPPRSGYHALRKSRARPRGEAAAAGASPGAAGVARLRRTLQRCNARARAGARRGAREPGTPLAMHAASAPTGGLP